ncbi:MAG: PQQ-binding-like beta-propeller repeat protein [Candidatus Pristimantibacillus sp.]
MKKLLWNYKLNGLRNPSISPGVIVDNKLFVAVCYSKKGFYESMLLAIQLDTQAVDTILTLPHLIRNTVLIEDDKLYLTSFDGSLYCIHYDSYQIEWKYETNPSRNLNPNIISSEDSIIVTEMHGQARKTYCIDKQTGSERWNFESGHHVASNLLIKENKVYHGSSGGAYYCLDINNGEVIWSFGDNLYVHYAEFLLDRYILLCSSNGQIYILTIDKGEVIVNFDSKADIYTKPVVIHDRIYIGHENGVMECCQFEDITGLQPAVLTTRWTFDAKEKITTTAIIDGDSMLFGSEDSYLYQLSLSNGVVINQMKMKNVVRDVLIDQNNLIVLSDKGQVDCFEYAYSSNV